MYDQPSCLHCGYDDGQPFKSQREDNNDTDPSHVPVSSLSVSTSFGCRRKKANVHSCQLWYSRPQHLHLSVTVRYKRKIWIKWENLDETILRSHFSEDSKVSLLMCDCEVGVMGTNVYVRTCSEESKRKVHIHSCSKDRGSLRGG